ncbi:MAG: hypothetical protein U0798_21655 [Gemmataceae bacterium]
MDLREVSRHGGPQTKPQLLPWVLSGLEKKLPAAAELDKRPVMEEPVYADLPRRRDQCRGRCGVQQAQNPFFD